MTHSLTNEMCHELSCWPLEELDELYVDGVMTDMRAAYDLAIEHMSQWIKENGNLKPVIGFIAGETAPKGRTMGHAGAIVGGKDDTAEAKKSIMRSCGIHVVNSPADIGKRVAEVLA